MMRTLGLVLALLVVAGGVSMAATATFDIYDGWNLITCPIVPFDPAPTTVFANAVDGLDQLLIRNDPAVGQIAYDELEDPPGASFGNCLLGDGYWLRQYHSANISIDGVADGVPDGNNNMTDMWISLPGAGQGNGGWHLIGQPFNHDTPVDNGNGDGWNLRFTDGTILLNWSEAVQANWVSDQMYGNIAATGQFNLQYDGLGDDDTLRAGHGYWFRTYTDNIAMIVPAVTPVL